MRSRDACTIALDYTSGPGHAPGVGRYLRELVRGLVRLPARNAFPLELLEYGLAARPMEGAPLGLDGADGTRFTRRSIRLPRRLIALAQHAPRVGNALIGPSRRAGLIHRVTPDWPPIAGTRASLAIAEFPAPESDAAQRLADACRRAAGVIVFSEDGAERVADQYGLGAEKIFRSPVGSEHWERDLAEPYSLERSVAGPHTPRPTRDVLILGAIRNARFPLEALRAFGVLKDRNVECRLLVVGRPGDAQGEWRVALSAFKERHGQDSVRWIDRPVESRMPVCVAGASVLLHLAQDEASPVTPLEAARMGVPLVMSPLPAFREVFGQASAGAAAFVDAGDPASIADALEAALQQSGHPDVLNELTTIARPFTWHASAEAHCRAWERMLDLPPSCVTPTGT